MDALLMAREAWVDGADEVEASIRRLATVAGHVASRERELDAARAARALADAPVERLAVQLDDLLGQLRRAMGVRSRRGELLLACADPALAEVLTMIVRPYADQVTAVDSVSEARQVALRQRFSAALLHLPLSDGDARDLLSEWALDPAYADLPMLVLVEEDDTLARAECLALGAREVHTLPPDAVGLTTALAVILGHEHRASLEYNGDTVTGLHDDALLSEAANGAAEMWTATGRPWAVLAVVVDETPTPDVARALATQLRTAMQDTEAWLGFTRDALFAVVPGMDLRHLRHRAEMLHERLTYDGALGVGGIEGAHARWDQVSATARRMAQLACAAGQPVVVEASREEARGDAVLVVDDDPTTATTLERRLGSDGFRIMRQSDGLQLEAALERIRPRAMVVDLDLPHIDGFQVVRTVRAHSRFGKTPVLVLSSVAAARHELEAFAAGADDFLSKPADPEVLRARVARLARAGSSR